MDPAVRPSLHLRQQVTLQEAGMEVCRTLSNVSATSIVLPPLQAEGDSYGQFSTWAFDTAGEFRSWRELREDDLRITHGSFIFPPPPPGPNEAPPSLTLGPNEAFRNCQRLPIPPLQPFSLVSRFSPVRGVMIALGSPTAGTEVNSNTCYINGREVDCEQ